jgi:molecular chaperone HscA
MNSLVKIIKENGLSKKDIYAVITIPAYFDEKARSVVKRMASLSGIFVIRLINEPTAAVIVYSDYYFSNILENNKSYLVYDLGGGTFDISVIKKYEGNFFRVLGIGGDKFLGGDDFDKLIADNLRERNLFEGINESELLSISKKIKEDFETSEYFTRDDLYELFNPLIEKTIKIMDSVIQDCHKRFENLMIDTLILVGGSTRLQFIQDALSKQYKILNQYNPDEIVVIGAGLHAKTLSDENKNHILLDAVGMSFGLEIAGGGVEKFIERNSPIPISKTQVFTTQVDNQKSIRISICQGESEKFDENILLGQFSLRDLPEAQAGTMQIEVTFLVDADGILTVKATEKETKKAIYVEFAV